VPFSRFSDWEKPPPSPDTPPDTSDLTGPCPRCGNRSNFSVAGTIGVTFGGGVMELSGGQRERVDVQQAAILECLGCNDRLVVIEDKYVNDESAADGVFRSGTINYRGVSWWPPPGAADLDASIPEEIRHAYQEGIRAMWAQAPNAAAVMFRRTLEGVVKKSGSAAAQTAARKNLASGLQAMAAEGALDKSLAEWAKEIRIVANFGAHFDPQDDVSPEEADNLSRLIREVLRYLYEMPARIQRTRPPHTPSA
jgi:hypothetical protein